MVSIISPLVSNVLIFSFSKYTATFLSLSFLMYCRQSKVFLANRLIDLVIIISPGNITEEKESELEEFIDNARILMGALGHKLFDPLTNQFKHDTTTDTLDDDILLFMKRKSSKSGLVIEAICKQTNEGFVVLKGSHIETIDSDSIPSTIKERRKKARIDKNGILQEDILFRSPSYAAAFVIGVNTNGLKDWKTRDGLTLKELEDKQHI